MTENYYRWKDKSLYLRVRVQPRASQDGVGELVGDRLRIRITAPPVDGKANEHLIRYLARAFGVKPTAVRLARGHTGRDKVLEVNVPARLPTAFPGLEYPT